MTARFDTGLQNRFSGLPLTKDTSVEEEWRNFKSQVQKVASSELGMTKRNSKDWISLDTIELVEKTQEARKSNSPSYCVLRRETAHSARRNKNRYWCKVATDMEQAASVGDSRKLFQLLRSATKTSCGISETIVNNQGGVISDLSQRSESWAVQFARLLNHPPPAPQPLP